MNMGKSKKNISIKMDGDQTLTYLRICQSYKDWLTALVASSTFFLVIIYIFGLHLQVYYGRFIPISWLKALFLMSPWMYVVYTNSHLNQRICITRNGIMRIKKKRSMTEKQYWIWKEIKEVSLNLERNNFLIIDRVVRRNIFRSPEVTREVICLEPYLSINRNQTLSKIDSILQLMCRTNHVKYSRLH